MFYKSDLPGALAKYEESLEVDKENEYAIANIGVIHLKKLDYSKCIDYSSRALSLVEGFQTETKSFSKINILEVKLLLRRAKSYEMNEKWEEAKRDLDKTIMLEPQNSEARTLLKVVQGKLDDVLFSRYREEGNEFLKVKKFQ